MRYTLYSQVQDFYKNIIQKSIYLLKYKAVIYLPSLKRAKHR